MFFFSFRKKKSSPCERGHAASVHVIRLLLTLSFFSFSVESISLPLSPSLRPSLSIQSLYGFFWKQFGTLEVVSGCTIAMLHNVYDGDGIKLRRREYYTMPGFRKYENDTGHILVQWSVGSPVHFAGWHCSWCFAPEGIFFKLVSAQNGDFPRWGDYEDKRDLNYIRELIRTGGWFDGSLQEYPPVDPKEHMYAPKYMLENYSKYRYLLENPYSKVPRLGKG